MILWLAVFAFTVLADIAWARYFLAAASRNAFAASLWSGVIVALGSFTTVEYVNNRWLVSAAIAGALVGTYYSVRTQKA